MFQQLSSKVRDSIQPIIGNSTRRLTCGFTKMLGRYDKLKKYSVRFASQAMALKANREPLRRLARGVAFIFSSLLMGISLSTPADGGSLITIDPKSYIRLHYSPKEALCLIKLYGRESAFNSKAIGNEDGIKKAYGIPQLKNPIIKDLSPNKQIDYGMKYIEHRYMGSPCIAYAHSNRYGWY